MKRLIAISIALLLGFMARAQYDSLDVVKYAPLDSLLTQFYGALASEDNDVKASEMDNLISSCQDSLTRQHVALQIYDHYSHTRIRGEEAVAVHIYDKWFEDGPVKARSEFEEIEMWQFANFNRSTLLGMKAPKVALYKPCGGTLEIPADGRISTLFFFDVNCAKCRLELEVLPSVLEEVDFPMNFYAVYAGSDRASWRKYRRSFKVDNRNVKVVHLWDPKMNTDYLRLYGVNGTPRMYVTLEDGEVIGRRLEVINLQEIFSYISVVYGKETQ